ncbi:PA14 domain-containing protein [Paenibacillus qinlingensis]|uniref:PA14 domain-containing protein n=1 Tax=Paenibacillus qinlingensis TaxID=1837343 RepID=UPI00156670E3|nr:PA14 domain-containing protein [Paenibacillus qinlingensis]NQX60115.1 DUF1349 domain-containing protein [Paenibacillus qinlingensis]
MKFKDVQKMLLMLVMVVSLSLPSLSITHYVQAAEAETHGLKGDYYTSSGSPSFNFGTLKATTVDANLDFSSLETALKLMTGQSDNVNVRWTGSIVPAYSENYTFSIIGDNGFRLWVNNQLVLDHWVNDWDKEQTGTPIALVAGQKVDFKLEYFEATGGSNLHVRWSSPSLAKQAIPTDALFTPAGYKSAGRISEDGTKAEINFDNALSAPPLGGFGTHLKVDVAGTNWPIASAALQTGNSSVLVLTFENPIYSKDVSQVGISYDGNGTLQQGDGSAIGAFSKFLKNDSTYQIMTPWAEQLDPANVLPEYPRPQLARAQWMNLNGEWEFQAAKASDAIPTSQTLKEKILVPFAAESILSGIHRTESLMWYKRSFTIPDSWSGQRVKLNFGAVDYLATVYVNGQLVGSHKGGFTAFSLDITDQLKTGPNELIVKVLDNTDSGEDQAVGKQTVKKLGGIWYTSSSGIWQTVWMEPVAPAHIDKLDMVPDITNQVLKLKVAASGVQGETVKATASINGQVVGTATGTPGTDIAIPVPNARLWSPDDPFLYELKVSLNNGSQSVDQVDSYFGMREIKTGLVDGVMRTLLNGKPVFMMGPLDQGYYPDGIYTAPTEEALQFDLATIKRIGMNTVRKHIKIEPARWYYWADKMGLLVWQDMPSLEDRQGNKGSDISQAAKTQWLKEYKEMVDQLQSTPSIVTWTVFNEGWGEFDQGGQLSKDAVNLVKSWDSTRLINGSSGWWDTGVGDLNDAHSYPAPASPAPSANRASVIGEYGGLGLHVTGHEWTPLTFSYQLMSSKQEITDKYIGFIDSLKQQKANGLNAAIYTQITDVEYEINGLLTYDRKVEKLDFDRIAKAHRELIGTANKADLLAQLALEESFLGAIQIGSQPGAYPQAAVDQFTTTLNAAKAVNQDVNATVGQIQGALNSLVAAHQQILSTVHAPIPNGFTTDSFDSTTLAPAWTIFRPDSSKWSLTANPGSLRLQSLAGDMFGNSNASKNVFLQNAPVGDFVITTKITGSVNKNYEQGGLLVWQDEDNYVRIGHVWDTTGATGKNLESAFEKNAVYTKASNVAKHPGTDSVYLMIAKVGNVYTTSFWNGTAWQQAADPMTVNLSNVKVGFYAMSATDGTSIPVDVDYFAVGGPALNEPSFTWTGPAVVSSGQPFNATLSLDSVTEAVYAEDLTVTYDPTQLEFVSVEELHAGVTVVDKAVTPGKVRLIIANIGVADVNGAMLQLNWQAKSLTSTANATVLLSSAVLANGVGQEKTLDQASLAVQITGLVNKAVLNDLILQAQSKHDVALEGSYAGQYPNGSKAVLQTAIDGAKAVAVDASASTEQVTQAVNALQSALNAFLASVHTATPGDVNTDGKFSVGELAQVAAAYGKTSADLDWEQYKQMDVNGDHIVDIEDLAAVAQLILQ